jgi:hypothetical protein
VIISYPDEDLAAREDEREELDGAVEEQRVEVPWEVAGDEELVAEQAHDPDLQQYDRHRHHQSSIINHHHQHHHHHHHHHHQHHHQANKDMWALKIQRKKSRLIELPECVLAI